jgi:hypothetical protein
MNMRNNLKNLRTGDVEIGFGPLKRMAADIDGWVCEHCGEARHGKTAPKDTSKPPCKSKSGAHKWRRV